MADPEEALKLEYQTLVAGHDRITDFRARLLGFLPLGSTAAIGVLAAVRDDAPLLKNYFWAVGVFGFLVTVGLYFFEWHQMMHCGAIIDRASFLERELGFGVGGFFTIRPKTWIDAHTAGYIVYGVVAVAWATVIIVAHSGVFDLALGWVLIVASGTVVCVGLFRAVAGSNRRRSGRDPV